MPCTRERAQRLRQTTARGWFYQNPTPKYKYIEDPSEFVFETDKNQTSQYNIPYHEMWLKLAPVFGRFAGTQLLFVYDWDTVTLKIDLTDEYVIQLKPGTSPDVFTRWCLEFAYSSERRINIERAEGADCIDTLDVAPKPEPDPLRLQSLRSALLHVDHIRASSRLDLPADIRDFFDETSSFTMKLSLWPSYVRGESIVLPVKRGMLVCELALLVRTKLKLKAWFEMRFYQNCLPLDGDDSCVADEGAMGCLITSPWSKGLAGVSWCAPTSPTMAAQKQVIVASVVGRAAKELEVNLSLPLRFLDSQLRREFRLRPKSVLAIHLPDRCQNVVETGAALHSGKEEESAKRYVSNGKRNFPTLDGESSTSDIRELHKHNAIYRTPLRDIGFFPGIFIEVFEVTGPSIPIMYFGEVVTKTHVLDVNPDWPVETFLRYVHVSIPGASKVRSVDYVREFKDRKVEDILNMMSNLWTHVEKVDHLEYLRIRS